MTNPPTLLYMNLMDEGAQPFLGDERERRDGIIQHRPDLRRRKDSAIEE
jgi:hypothetical protein